MFPLILKVFVLIGRPAAVLGVLQLAGATHSANAARMENAVLLILFGVLSAWIGKAGLLLVR